MLVQRVAVKARRLQSRHSWSASSLRWMDTILREETLPFSILLSELEIRGGTGDNSNVIFLNSQ